MIETHDRRDENKPVPVQLLVPGLNVIGVLVGPGDGIAQKGDFIRLAGKDVELAAVNHEPGVSIYRFGEMMVDVPPVPITIHAPDGVTVTIGDDPKTRGKVITVTVDGGR